MEYRNRFKKTLYNPTLAESIEREPLLKFSFYLSGRVLVLCSIAEEIIENLDTTGFQFVDGRADSLMWLWVFGAYEVVRTMHQAKKCFSEDLNAKLGMLKGLLGTARIPSAKMEKRGKKIPVSSNRGPSGWDLPNRDLLLGDPEGPAISARRLLLEFDRTISSITPDDVLDRHENSYSAAQVVGTHQ